MSAFYDGIAAEPEESVAFATAYYATRLLLQQGFDARNLSGGMLSRTYAAFFLQDEPIE